MPIHLASVLSQALTTDFPGIQLCLLNLCRGSMWSLSEKKLRLVKNDLSFVIPAGFYVNCAISNVQYSPLTDVMEQMGMHSGT